MLEPPLLNSGSTTNTQTSGGDITTEGDGETRAPYSALLLRFSIRLRTVVTLVRVTSMTGETWSSEVWMTTVEVKLLPPFSLSL